MLRALVVSHHPSTAPAVGRIVELAGGIGQTSIATSQVSALDIGSEDAYVGVRLDRLFHVVHLVPDATLWGASDAVDSAGAVWTGLRGNIERVNQTLLSRHPALRGWVAHWVVTSLGNTFDDVEESAIRELVASGTVDGFRGFLSVSPSTSTVALTSTQRLVGMADVTYSLVCSPLGDVVFERNTSLAHAGVASVVFRRRRTSAAALAVLGDTIDRLIGPLDRTDTSSAAGRSDMSTEILGVRRDGGSKVADQLARDPVAGNVAGLVANRLDQIDRSVRETDPGMWAGLLAYEMDRLTVISGEGDGPVSPLAAAVDRIQRNGELLTSELQQGIRNRVAGHFRASRSLEACSEWCRGASEVIREQHAQLQLPRSNVQGDQLNLADRSRRLRKATQWLPDGNALLIRGLMLVLMALVVAYTYAVLPQLVAVAFGLDLPFVGGDLEANSQIWARITAGALGLGIGLWWISKWATAVRWRRSYVKAAGRVVNGRIEEELRLHQIRILEALMRTVGSADADMSIAGWIDEARPALEGLAEVVRAGAHDDSDLLESPFSLVLPSDKDIETYRIHAPTGDQVGMRGPFLDRLEDSLRSCTAVAPLLEESRLVSLSGGLPTDIRRYFEMHREYVSDAHRLLDADLRPRGEGPQIAGVEAKRYLIVEPEVERMLGAAGWRHPMPTIASSLDAQFVCSLWLAPFTVDGDA